MTSESVTGVLGIQPEEFTIPYALSRLYPEDISYFINFGNKVTEFFRRLPPGKVLSYKVSYDY
ncbi:hypothetical protein ACFPMF_19265 [Larkinella bovis]|uniref:Uncharacterized protein n=1 Tax=Larkinella bovis TaxID=683041 RepID=A0ABW0IDY0_9BACT